MTTEPSLKVHEAGSGIPLLWIHGFPLSSEVFAPQKSITGIRHLLPDLPGFGDSVSRPIDSIASYARLMVALLDERQIPRAIVAGLSMGGYIAMEMLRQARERVAGLVLIDTRETPDDDAGRLKRVASAREVEVSGTQSVVDSMLPKMLSASATPGLRETTQAMMMKSSKEGVIAALHAMASRSDSTEVLRGITVPTLIIVGELDAITPLADATRMQTLIPGARLLVVPGAAHLSNVERPDIVNPGITAFLRSQSHLGAASRRD